MKNQFSERMAVLSDIELFKVIKLKDEYDDLAVEAAITEIKERKLTNEEKNAITTELELTEQKKKAKEKLFDLFIKKSFEFIKCYLIPIPTDRKSPAPYINILAIFIITGVVIKLLIPIFYLIPAGYYSEYGYHIDDLIELFISLFIIYFAISLMRKKRFGWIMLTFFATLFFARKLVLLYFPLFIYNIDPDGFNNLLSFLFMMLELIIPLIILRYINKQLVLNYFKISTVIRKITLIMSVVISILLFIFWIYLESQIYEAYK